MKKEKHKWKKVRDKTYFQVTGEPDYHEVLVQEYYMCEKCGSIRSIREMK